MTKKIRYTTIDVIRGLAVISMLIYHSVWDLVYIFGVNIPFYRSICAHIWQQSILWTFVILSGFCVNIGRKRLKRAVTVIVCSIIISLVTYLFMPQNLILFGVLSFMGTAMLVTVPFDKVLKKINPFSGVAICALLFAATRSVAKRTLFGHIDLPDFLYSNNITAFLGFPSPSFVSQDYVPFMPWIFLFLCGYFLKRISDKSNSQKAFSALKFRPVEWLGRHSLEIYMIHQPLIYGLLLIFFKLI